MRTATIHVHRNLTMPPSEVSEIMAFPSRLGWMAIAMAGDRLMAVSFGRSSAQQALAALGPLESAQIVHGGRIQALADRFIAMLVVSRTSSVTWRSTPVP